MSGALFYPPADRASQWFGGEYPGTTMAMTRPKVLLHSTETAGGWPPYAGGATAPNLTYDPFTHRWRQHFRLNQSARALRDPTSTPVRENRADVCQVELSCYCDPQRFSTGHGIASLDDQAYSDIGRFLAFMHVEWRVPLESSVRWKAYPASYGTSNGVRLTSEQYAGYTGVLGHQHAPGQDHGDPGDLDVARILMEARAHLTRGARVDRCVNLLTHSIRDTHDPATKKHLKAAQAELLAIPERVK